MSSAQLVQEDPCTFVMELNTSACLRWRELEELVESLDVAVDKCDKQLLQVRQMGV